MSLRDLKNTIEEFDYEAGMGFCGDDEEFFADMMQEYIDSDKKELLINALANEDWNAYGINVHSLKSTSRMMGFPELGELCEGLQKAAENADEAYIIANHDAMISRYESYCEVIKKELE